MNMPTTLVNYLTENNISYDKLHHHHTATSMHTAHAASIPGSELAKSVILEDKHGYVMAVIPATSHVKIKQINKLLKRNLGLATEAELQNLFIDCELGAIPPIGQAYGLTTVVDYSLEDCEDIYFEAGNHEDLIHLNCSAFHQLMKNSEHANICNHN